MGQLILDRTLTTPEVNFMDTGYMLLKGSILPEDPKVFFASLFEWIENTNASKLEIRIKLNYINTSSSKRIIEFLIALDKERKFQSIKLKWYFESDDSDMLEFGQLIQRNLKKAHTEFVECEDIDNC